MVQYINDPNPEQLTGAIGSAFLLLINILIVQKGGLFPKDIYPNDVAPHMEDNLDINFDFVIIGAGAAGCALANRLTEHFDWRVLLVEAGHDPSSTSDVPAFYPSLLNTQDEWRFVTKPSSTSCLAMVGKVCKIPKGRVLGGTSSINNLLYMRGISKDFENWVNMGNLDWEPDTSDYFYRKSENHKGLHINSLYGTSGTLSLDNFESDHYVKDLIFKAAKALKYNKMKEHDYLGYTENVAMLKEGTRHNMAKAFLTPIKYRPNSFILKNCYATKIDIPDLREKRTKGVQCAIGDTLINIRVKKEVILSMGGINTPKLLMLSGIGPAEVLNQFNIPIVANLRVGENMQEHLGVPIFVGLDKDNNKLTDQLNELVDATYQYMMRRRGPLAMTNINDLVGFINTNSEPYEYPNVMIYHYYFYPDDINLKSFLENIGYEPEIIRSLLKHNHNQTLVMFLPTLLKPKSRGNILIQSTDPFQNPTIVSNFLTDSEDDDLKTLESGFKFIRGMTETTAFAQHNAQLLHVDIPNCRNLKFCTDHFIKCHIRNLAYPQGDIVGTTKMGPLCDPNNVVNEDLLVKGVRGLRIVDASIMPEIVSGNIQATSAMIGQKVSECIKARWLKNYKLKPPCKCKKNL